MFTFVCFGFNICKAWRAERDTQTLTFFSNIVIQDSAFFAHSCEKSAYVCINIL